MSEREDKLQNKLSFIGAQLLRLVDGDPLTKGHAFWPHIRMMIEMIKKDVTIEDLCFGCMKTKPRAAGWQRKELPEMGIVPVCPDCCS